MSQVTLYDPFKGMRGKYGKVVMRQKKYRAPNGAVLIEGVQEAYPVTRPRDYEKNPPQGDELANINFFGDVSRLAAEIINSGKYTEEELTAMSEEMYEHVMQLRAQLEDFQRRYLAQIKRPDPEAPYENAPRPGSTLLRRKQYKTLRTFIQAILRERAKNQQ